MRKIRIEKHRRVREDEEVDGWTIFGIHDDPKSCYFVRRRTTAELIRLAAMNPALSDEELEESISGLMSEESRPMHFTPDFSRLVNRNKVM